MCNDTLDNLDRFVYTHDGPFFTANLLRISASRSRNSNFNLFLVQAGGQNITTITGNGVFQHRGDGEFDTLHIGKNAFFDDKQTNFMSILKSGRDDHSHSHHIKALTDAENVFSITSGGDLLLKGNANFNNKALLIRNGVVSMNQTIINNRIRINGTTEMEGTLFFGVKKKFGFWASQASGVVISTKSAINTSVESVANVKSLINGSFSCRSPLFSILNPNPNIAATLIKLQSSSNQSSYITAIDSNGNEVFDISADGDVSLSSLFLQSGGIDVLNGGIRVNGGMNISGSIEITSGTLSVQGGAYKVGRLIINDHADTDIITERNSIPDETNMMSHSLLKASTLNFFYTGTAISIDIPNSKQEFSFLKFMSGTRFTDIYNRSDGMDEIQSPTSNLTFEISSTGDVFSLGGATFNGQKGMTVTHQSNLKSIAVSKTSIKADNNIYLPANTTFLEIVDDGKNGSNVLLFTKEVRETTKVGQLLLISNLDSEAISGVADVDSYSTLLFIFDGQRFNSVQASRSQSRELVNVRVLEISQDLHVGNHSFGANNLVSSSLTEGGIIVAGFGGLLVSPPALNFRKGI